MAREGWKAEDAFSGCDWREALSLLCLALRARQSPQLRWVPGDTAYLWGKPPAPSEVEGNSGRGQNSPVDKPLKRPAREPWNVRKGIFGRLTRRLWVVKGESNSGCGLVRDQLLAGPARRLLTPVMRPPHGSPLKKRLVEAKGLR
jgi:hypothetical protein